MAKRLNDPPLVPSSMNATNTVSEDASLAMTAPGSPGVVPPPRREQQDVLPLPQEGKQSPVNPQRDRVKGNPQTPGQDSGGGWKSVSGSGEPKKWDAGPYSADGHVSGPSHPNAGK